jgi:hypothetical protein
VRIAEGVDDETWLFHLQRGDDARWFRDVIKDEGLAREATAIATRWDLPARDSRNLIRAAIESRYAAPA